MGANVTVLMGLLAVVLILAAVWLSPLYRGNGNANVASALRAILQARASGEIDAAEFAQREQALHELALRAEKPKVLGNWFVAVPLAIAGLALLVYALSGRSGLESTKSSSALPPGLPWEMNAATMKPAQLGQGPQKGGDLNTLVKGLSEKMERDPDNAEGWLLLARTHVELRQHADAARAFAHVAKLGPLDGTGYADWVDAHVMANDRQWDDQARSILKQALKADGKNAKVLSLAGSEAFDRKRYKEAIEFWKRQKAVESKDSIGARLAESNIEEASAILAGKASHPEKQQSSSTPASIAGTVAVDQSFGGKVGPKDTVFVIVRAADGSNPPLAVKKVQASDLPYRFELTDADAMVPGRAISAFAEVLVSARISKSGEPTTQPGDFMSNVARVRPGETAIELRFGGGR